MRRALQPAAAKPSPWDELAICDRNTTRCPSTIAPCPGQNQSDAAFGELGKNAEGIPALVSQKNAMDAREGSYPDSIATLLWTMVAWLRTSAALVATNVSPNSHRTRPPPRSTE